MFTKDLVLKIKMEAQALLLPSEEVLLPQNLIKDLERWQRPKLKKVLRSKLKNQRKSKCLPVFYATFVVENMEQLHLKFMSNSVKNSGKRLNPKNQKMKENLALSHPRQCQTWRSLVLEAKCRKLNRINLMKKRLRSIMKKR